MQFDFEKLTPKIPSRVSPWLSIPAMAVQFMLASFAVSAFWSALNTEDPRLATLKAIAGALALAVAICIAVMQMIWDTARYQVIAARRMLRVYQQSAESLYIQAHGRFLMANIALEIDPIIPAQQDWRWRRRGMQTEPRDVASR